MDEYKKPYLTLWNAVRRIGTAEPAGLQMRRRDLAESSAGC